jgi:hypothetical protein
MAAGAFGAARRAYGDALIRKESGIDAVEFSESLEKRVNRSMQFLYQIESLAPKSSALAYTNWK